MRLLCSIIIARLASCGVENVSGLLQHVAGGFQQPQGSVNKSHTADVKGSMAAKDRTCEECFLPYFFLTKFCLSQI